MKLRLLIDENVSLELARVFRSLGYEVDAVAESGNRGMSDEEVLDLAVALKAALITRDAHFTNPIRFDPGMTAGIIHIVHGNLTAAEETALVKRFLETARPADYRGKLVLLTRESGRIR